MAAFDPFAAASGVIDVPVQSSCCPVQAVRIVVHFLTLLGDPSASKPPLYGLRLRVPMATCSSLTCPPMEVVARLLQRVGLPEWAVEFATRHIPLDALASVVDAATFFRVPVYV